MLGALAVIAAMAGFAASVWIRNAQDLDKTCACRKGDYCEERLKR